MDRDDRFVKRIDVDFAAGEKLRMTEEASVFVAAHIAN